MNDDALKDLWRGQNIAGPAVPTEQEFAAMRRRVKQLDRALFWRDVRENIAAVIVLVIFSFYFFKYHAPLARVGSVIVVVSSLFTVWYPIRQKRALPKLTPEASVTDSLRFDLQKTEIEIGLLRSVLWWYILPLAVGCMLFYLGLADSLQSSLGFGGSMIALDIFIYWLNQRAVDSSLLPLKRELETLLIPEDVMDPVKPGLKDLMLKLLIIVAATGLCFAVAKVVSAAAPSTALASKDLSAINQMLENICAKEKVPALAIAVVYNGKIVATNAVGVRKYGGAEKVTVDDMFHLGSVTKSMTATVAGMLVEQGKISWTSTVGEMFPEFKERIDPGYLPVTLEQLLSHRGGAPADPPANLWRKAWDATGSASAQRLAFTQGILAEKPATTPGTKFIYSNQGYAIAGVMLERAAGKPWEELLRQMLFAPLGMKSAGFGAPASPDQVDQPWGHTEGVFSLSPVPPGPSADNPLAISPANAVHCSIEDLAKYAAFHLAGERGEGTLLKPATFKKLHQAVGDEYALGWMVKRRGWAQGNALMHNGSNTTFYAVVWIAPERDFAVVVAANTGSDRAFGACDAAASELIHQYLEK